MIEQENILIYVDEVSTTLSYIGKAARDSADDKPVWQLKEVKTTGTVTTIKFAEGSDRFNYVWDDRASYTYK